MNIKISIRVILLFTIAILYSYLGDYLSPYLGDWTCQGSKWVSAPGVKYDHIEGCDLFNIHNPTLHWGYRHYLFLFMGIALFVIQTIEIVNSINKKPKQ